MSAPTSQAPARRPPAGRPPTLPTTLPPTLRRDLRWPRTWPETAVGVGAGGALAYGGAPLMGRPGLSIALGVSGMLAASVTAAAGARSARQADLIDGIVEAIAPRLGQRCKVRARLWHGGVVGVPARLRIDYSAAAVDDDPAWQQDLLESIERRLGTSYRVHRLNQRRCRLWLRTDPEAAAVAAEPVPPVLARAERIVTEVLGGSCTVTATWSGETLLTLAVDYTPTMRVTSPLGRARVERAVSLLVPGRWRARWDLEEDHVLFELRPTLPTKVPHLVDPITAENLYRIPLAIDEDGRLVTWDMVASPHLMVVGTTGGGKTVTILGVVMEVARRGWPVHIVDPKRIEFLGMRGWPNVQVVATTVLDQVAVILNAWRVMEDRYSQVEAGLADERDFEPMLLVLDEVKELYSALDEWWAAIKRPGMPARCPIFAKIASLARKGRSARVHIVLGTQRPDADFLTGEMRDNFRARISQGPLSPQGAMMMWESVTIGVGLPRKVPGRATAVGVDDQPVEVQTLWTPDPRRAHRDEVDEDLQILEALVSGVQVDHARLQVELNEDLLTQLDEKGRSQEWEAACGAILVPALDLDTEEGAAAEAPRLLGRSTSSAAPGSRTSAAPGSRTGSHGDAGAGGGGSPVPRDGRDDRIDPALLTLAAEVVMTTQFASTAMLQRKLRVGFAHAHRLLQQLEDLGVVGPADPDRPDRPVLLPAEDLDTITAKLRALDQAYADLDVDVDDVEDDGHMPAAGHPRPTASSAVRHPRLGPAVTQHDPGDAVDLPDYDHPSPTHGDTLEEDFEGYGDPDVIYAREIRPGDLVFVSDAWVIVEDAGPDLDEAYICLDVRSDYDERDSVAVAESEMFEVRRPVEDQGGRH